MSQYIFLLIFIFLINFGFSFSLIPPISLIKHKTYTFSLNSTSKYIIYSYRNRDNISDYDVVFRFSNVPKYSTKFFLYYS